MTTEGMAEAKATSLTPGVISSYRNTWRQLWKYFFKLLLAFLVLEAIGYLISFAIPRFIDESWQRLVLTYASSFLIAGPLFFGFAYMMLRAVRNEKVEIQDLFESFKYYLNTVLANVLYNSIIILPFFLAVIIFDYIPVLGFIIILPIVLFAVIAACKLAFIPFLVTDKRLRAFKAIKTSWNMTNSHAGKVFLIVLLGAPVLVAGNILLYRDVLTAAIICLVLSVIISIWMYLALAWLYHALDMYPGVSSSQTVKPLKPDEPNDYPPPKDKRFYPTDSQRVI